MGIISATRGFGEAGSSGVTFKSSSRSLVGFACHRFTAAGKFLVESLELGTPTFEVLLISAVRIIVLDTEGVLEVGDELVTEGRDVEMRGGTTKDGVRSADTVNPVNDGTGRVFGAQDVGENVLGPLVREGTSAEEDHEFGEGEGIEASGGGLIKVTEDGVLDTSGDTSDVRGRFQLLLVLEERVAGGLPALQHSGRHGAWREDGNLVGGGVNTRSDAGRACRHFEKRVRVRVGRRYR